MREISIKIVVLLALSASGCLLLRMGLRLAEAPGPIASANVPGALVGGDALLTSFVYAGETTEATPPRTTSPQTKWKLRLAAESSRWQGRLKGLASEKGSWIEVVDQRSAAWRLKEKGEARELALVETTPEPGEACREYLCPPNHHLDQVSWLREVTTRLARATNLLSFAKTQAARPREESVTLSADLVRFENRTARVGRTLSGGTTLEDGDTIAVRIRNQEAESLDLTVLHLDATGDIQAFFPDPQMGEDNRLQARRSLLTPRFAVTRGRTDGREHFVVIGVRAGERPVDFGFLAKPNREGMDTFRCDPKEVLASPLGRCFSHLLYTPDEKGESAEDDLKDSALRVLSWRAIAKEGR